MRTSARRGEDSPTINDIHNQRRNSVSITVKMVLKAKAMYPDFDDEEIEEVCQEWMEQRAQDREIDGYPEDTYCLEDGRDNCNDWGTGEGQFHGRI